MPRLETVQLVNREAQTSDTAVYRRDLPSRGCVSAIDVGIRITNYTTPPTDKEIMDVISHLSLVCNGTDYRVHVKGPDLFRINWHQCKKPMKYTFDETASTAQEVWFRLLFGRYLGDPQLGLDLSRFNNVQLQIDYALSNFGTVGTHVTTGSFTVSIILHQFPLSQSPSFRGMIGLREFWTYTTVGGSAEKVQALPAQNSLKGLYVMCRKDATAEATCVTDIKIGKDTFNTVWYDGKWYNFQMLTNQDIQEPSIKHTLYLSNAETRAVTLANIRKVDCQPREFTLGVA